MHQWRELVSGVAGQNMALYYSH